MKITVEFILENSPCGRYPEKRIKSILGKGKSVKKFLKLPDKLFDRRDDRLWVLTIPGVLPERLLHEIGIYAAELVLPIYEKEYPDDARPRKAIEAKKLWIAGKISDDELEIAWWEARAAAALVADALARASLGVSWAVLHATMTDPLESARSAAEAAAWSAGEKIYKKIFKFVRKRI